MPTVPRLQPTVSQIDVLSSSSVSSSSSSSCLETGAAVACDFCRRRKRRCDGEKPCSTCREFNADCHYQELPTETVGSPSGSISINISEALSDRLGRIEALLEEQNQRLGDVLVAAQPPSQSQTLPESTSASASASASASVSRKPSPLPIHTLPVHAPAPPDQQEQFLIPLGHTASANALLALPVARNALQYGGFTSLATSKYCRTYFEDLEKAWSLPPDFEITAGRRHRAADADAAALLSLLSMPAGHDPLAESYFRLVHPALPLFGRSQLHQWTAQARDAAGALNLDLGFDDRLDVALCCCVWALGCLALPTDEPFQEERLRAAQALMGSALRTLARQALWAFGTREQRLQTCQGLLLAAAYFAHMARPLHSARMVHIAGRLLLVLFEELRRDTSLPKEDEKLVRAFWVCFMMESDRAAEFDVPRSGVEPMADCMALANCLDVGENDVMIAFVAETSVRRLLNRIHNLLYAADSKRRGSGLTDLNRILPISIELNRQLEVWHESIPNNLRPPLEEEEGEDEDDEDEEEIDRVCEKMDEDKTIHKGDEDDDDFSHSALPPLDHLAPSLPLPGPLDMRASVLRVRYYEARHLIHRPFVLGVAQQQRHKDDRAGIDHEPVDSAVSAVSTVSPAILDKAVVCVDASVAYLCHALPLMRWRTSYLWSLCQGCTACLVVLAVAETAGVTTTGIDVRRLQRRVARRLRPWATPGSSVEAQLEIVMSLGK